MGVDWKRLLELLGTPDGEMRIDFSWKMTARFQKEITWETPLVYLLSPSPFVEYIEYEAPLPRTPPDRAERGEWVYHDGE